MKLRLLVAVCLAGFSAFALQFAHEYSVDGNPVVLKAGETLVDLAKIYPNDFVPGQEGRRWAEVETTFVLPAEGLGRLYRRNDWFGELYVNGELVSGANGPADWEPVYVKFRRGANSVRFRTRSGIASWTCGVALDDVVDPSRPPAYADFSKPERPIRRALHSSGFGPTICSQTAQDLADVKSMGFLRARTHDWALVNPNQRVCDYFHIFPLMKLDAKDPTNYNFGPTDYLLKRTREEAGLDVLFRLGASIEHSGFKTHFNVVIPEDFDKVAETFAATVRHYNRGWANGYDWNIKYWEIWNEPEGIENMWFPAEGVEGLSGAALDAKRAECRRKFVAFYVKALRRLKDEFGDTVKVGGPALIGYNEIWLNELLTACKAAGVAPDFISWHGYTNDPGRYAREAERGRRLADGYGFTKTELILDEWHYFGANYSWDEMQLCSDPAVKARIWEGPDSHNGIRSACFTLATLANLQRSELDQAFYYGCAHTGAWGFKDAMQKKFKVYYALKLFGDIVRGYTTICASASEGSLYALAVTNPAGKKGLLVVDYRGEPLTFRLPVFGVSPAAKAKAVVLDHAHDLAEKDVAFSEGVLTVVKSGFHPAAVFVEFQE